MVRKFPETLDTGHLGVIEEKKTLLTIIIPSVIFVNAKSIVQTWI